MKTMTDNTSGYLCIISAHSLRLIRPVKPLVLHLSFHVSYFVPVESKKLCSMQYVGFADIQGNC